MKSVLWRVAKRLSYIEEARCLEVNLALLRVQWWVLVYAAMNLRVPLITGNFMTSRITIGIVKETVLLKLLREFRQLQKI